MSGGLGSKGQETGSGKDSYFQDEEEGEEVPQDREESTTSDGEENSKDEQRTRERKQLAMYLPADIHEDLRQAWLKYYARNPNSEKNKDFYPELIEKGIQAMGLED